MSREHLTSQPQTLVGFLKSIGGLRSCTELKLRDARLTWPGLVNDKRGLPLDHARRSAAEAGFFGYPQSDYMANTTIADFLDLLDRHPVYRPCDDERLWAWESAKRRKIEIAEAFEVELERIIGEPLGEVAPAEIECIPHDDPQPLLHPRHESALAWRKSIGLSRAKLGELSGYSVSTIQNFEEGGYRGKTGNERLIPSDAWTRYSLACAAISANLARPF